MFPSRRGISFQAPSVPPTCVALATVNYHFRMQAMWLMVEAVTHEQREAHEAMRREARDKLK
jgi:hypothetical protein